MSKTKAIEQKLSSALILLANLCDKIGEIKELLQTSDFEKDFNNENDQKIILPKGFITYCDED